jgi:phospho-N-acetylmuramoyl-pentapeptide-transferase
MLARLKCGQRIRKEECIQLYSLHRNKEGVPTMGGLLIILGVGSSVLLWTDLSNSYVWLVLGTMFSLGLLGLVDDFLKIKRHQSKGLVASQKMAFQLILGLVVGTYLYIEPKFSTQIDIPFFKEFSFELGPWYILFAAFVIIGTSNAVNLTDGLDGLAVGCVILVAMTYAILCYVSGNFKISDYLLVPYVPGTGELTVFSSALVGAGLGFLWFNAHPATVFMGDVGSLALGGGLGVVALLAKKELLLGLAGGIFVVEAVSVILQVVSYHYRGGRRIFKVAPLHHHFQMLGWDESKVIVRFWIIAILCSLATLATLKLR